MQAKATGRRFASRATSPNRTRASANGRGVALVDVRGRAIPVVDLRADPSRPGEYPKMFTGQLRRNVQCELDRASFTARVGTNVVYGKWLELGTRRMARRPWLSRGVAEDRLKDIDKAIRAQVSEAADFDENSPEPDAAELYTDVLVERLRLPLEPPPLPLERLAVGITAEQLYGDAPWPGNAP